MTHNQIRRLILKRLDELDRWYKDEYPDPDKIVVQERRIVYETAGLMAQLGFHRLHSAGLHRLHSDENLEVVNYLSCCLRALHPKRRAGSKSANPQPEMLTPPAVARQMRVSPEKVLRWIRAGELHATNITIKPGGRPKYRIVPTDLEVFRNRRTPQARVKTKRAKPSGKVYV